jgi:hypothetical protein
MASVLLKLNSNCETVVRHIVQFLAGMDAFCARARTYFNGLCEAHDAQNCLQRPVMRHGRLLCRKTGF